MRQVRAGPKLDRPPLLSYLWHSLRLMSERYLLLLLCSLVLSVLLLFQAAACTQRFDSRGLTPLIYPVAVLPGEDINDQGKSHCAYEKSRLAFYHVGETCPGREQLYRLVILT